VDSLQSLIRFNPRLASAISHAPATRSHSMLSFIAAGRSKLTAKRPIGVEDDRIGIAAGIIDLTLGLPLGVASVRSHINVGILPIVRQVCQIRETRNSSVCSGGRAFFLSWLP
jgi:hypothetical protein